MVELFIVTIFTLIGVLIFDIMVRQFLKDLKKMKALYKCPSSIKSKPRRANL